MIKKKKFQENVKVEMSLTIAEKYVAQNTIYLYNDILDVSFYSLIWKGEMIIAAWDNNNNYVVNIMGRWDEFEDYDELNNFIFEIVNSDA